jgi:hypothetical protein
MHQRQAFCAVAARQCACSVIPSCIARAQVFHSCLGIVADAAVCRWLLQMDLTLNIVERKTGGLSAGGGISAQGHADGAMPGFIGSFSYSQRNLFGLNQKLAATVELGQVRCWSHFVRIPQCWVQPGKLPAVMLLGIWCSKQETIDVALSGRQPV